MVDVKQIVGDIRGIITSPYDKFKRKYVTLPEPYSNKPLQYDTQGNVVISPTQSAPMGFTGRGGDGSGGGGGYTPSGQISSQQAEIQRQQQQTQEALRQQEQQQIRNLNQSYKENLRNVTSIQDKQSRLSKLREQISNIKDKTSQTIKTLWETGDIGLGGKAVTDVIGLGVSKLKEYETKKASEGRGVALIQSRAEDKAKQEREYIEENYQTNKLMGESKLDFIRRTKPKWYAGGSITQKYYEKVGGVEFYQPGEREELVNQGISNFTSAKTYEEQQEAIEQLKSQGINVTLKNNKYSLNAKKVYDKFAPTSKLAQTLVTLTHGFFISTLFSPLISPATAKKGSAKVKVKQEITYKRKFSDLSDTEYSNVINNIRIKTSPQELRNAYAKALRSGNKNLISDSEKILKDVLGNQKASILVRDVQAQEGFVSSSAKTGSLTLEVEVGELFNVPVISAEQLGTATGGTSILTGQKDLYIQKDVSRFQDMTKPSNIFIGGESKIKDLGVLGTRLDTQQPQTQKSILGLKTDQQMKQDLKTKQLLKQPQQELLRQKGAQKEALLLSSLLSQKQALKQKPIQRLAQQLKQPTKQKPTLKYPKPIIFGWGLGLGKALQKVKEMKDEKFEVFGKRFGEEISLGTFGTQKESELKAKQFLKGTLGRTSRILKDEKPLKFSELKTFGYEFRPAKRDTTKIIQKAKFSLGTKQETQEIQYFKKKAGKKAKRKSTFDWFS